MREIKFRAWDDVRGRMVFDFETIPYFDSRVITKYNTTVCMQYTGLKDKNGREIYEGDIVIDSTCGKAIIAVEFEDAGFTPFVRGSRYFCNDCDFDNARPEYCEVIGNIYQNPELLK